MQSYFLDSKNENMITPIPKKCLTFFDYADKDFIFAGCCEQITNHHSQITK